MTDFVGYFFEMHIEGTGSLRRGVQDLPVGGVGGGTDHPPHGRLPQLVLFLCFVLRLMF